MLNSYIYNLIKIKYIREGYLPDLPYHLISDNEMYDAFLSYNEEQDTFSGYFTAVYPAPSDSILLSIYEVLIYAIYRHICIAKGLESHSLKEYHTGDTIKLTDSYLTTSGMISTLSASKPISATNYTFLGLPNWVYSYMLGNTVSDHSDDVRDYADLLKSLGVQTITDMQYACLDISTGWLQKLPDDSLFYDGTCVRPPTIFGEPHVLKAIRIKETNLGVRE